MSLFSDFSNLVAIVEKDVPEFLELKDAVLKVIGDLAPGMMNAAPGEDLKSLVDRCDVACNKHAKKMNASPEALGKLFPGDGSFIKALLSIVLKLLPLIFANPAPTSAVV